jgi:hypothetical protein
VEYADGTVEFHVAGQLHRLDGPARDYVGGGHEYFVLGKRVPADEADVLESLWRQRDLVSLELVLSAWRPAGPTPEDLLDAIRVARG